MPSAFMLMPSFCRAKTDLDQADQSCLALLGPRPLGAEGLDRLDAGDVLDQVGGELGGLLHRLAGAPPGGRVVGRHARRTSSGTKAVATSASGTS